MKTNKLRCAYSTNSPYVYKHLTTGEIEGFTAEIAIEMASQLSLEVEWVEDVGYADFAQGLHTGRYDAYCGVITIMPTRARVAAFTTPLFYNPRHVYIRNDDTRFKSVSDMDKPEIKAAVIDGETFVLATKKHPPNSTLYSLPNMTVPGQLFVDVKNNKADVEFL